ncbi:MAG TPA: Uma2 family endonuclease [Gemmataceae bacterium]|nr:Uma2 family endonuclease [Gemmataceae bacterium]
MTTEELLAMPDDGVERWLIRGELREKRPPEGGPPMTVRNRFHSQAMVCVAVELEIWRRAQPEPRGQVLGGEAGVRLRQTPDSTVGVDVVYVPPDIVANQTDETTLIDGVPALAVEILSPSDTQEEIDEKIDEYLAAGVPLVWVLDPHDRTVTVYRGGTEPELVNRTQELSGDPHLPGFRVPVSRLFG